MLHVLAAITAVGPELGFGMLGPRARKGDAATARVVYDAIAAVRARIVYPALVLQIISGMALVEIVGRSVMRQAWMSAAMTLYTMAIALVALVLVPGSMRARRALAAGTDPTDEGLRPLWKRQSLAGGAAGTFLIAVAILMVWQPGR